MEILVSSRQGTLYGLARDYKFNEDEAQGMKEINVWCVKVLLSEGDFYYVLKGPQKISCNLFLCQNGLLC